MSDKLLVVGTDYVDYKDYVGGRIGIRGGIHNFIRSYPNCDVLGTDKINCWFQPINGKMKKVMERVVDDGFGLDTKIPNRDIHVCYGDSQLVLNLAKKYLPKMPSNRFVSVDMINPFDKISTHALEFWSKYADFIFVAADAKPSGIPRIVENSEAIWIFHNPKWVIAMYGRNNPIEYENPYYEELLDTIGAGDYFAGCLLRRLFDETGSIDIEESCKEVAEMLKVQNEEIQHGNPS